MKIKILTALFTLPLALILSLGITIISFGPSTHKIEPVSTESFSAPADQELYDFAYALITSWFNDCLRYVDEDDPTYEELEAEYGKIKDALENEDTDNLSQMLVFITSSFNRLDKIYYLWECSAYGEELEEAYKALKDSGAYTGNKKEIDEKYNTVLDLISDFQNELNLDLDNTLDLTNIRVGKSVKIETALEEAITRFDEIKFEWKQTQTFILWISISGGILLLAAIIVISLLLIMKKRNRKYKATLISFQDLQKVLDDESHGR